MARTENVSNAGATCTDQSSISDLREVRWLQWITVAWMAVELTISLISGLRAHSVALTAFGADSGIELLSALLVLRRFQVGPGFERTASRVAAVLLYTLAAYIILSSATSLLSERFRPEPSSIGMGLLIAAGVVMPLLGRAKRKLAEATHSVSLKADAAQSSICAYMSWISLAGIAVNAVFHLAWADSVAALCLLPFVLREANEARKGERCGC